jgi:hypothetical protein
MVMMMIMVVMMMTMVVVDPDLPHLLETLRGRQVRMPTTKLPLMQR